MLASGQVVRVATDWTAFGLFFVALASLFGAFVGFVLRRMDRNRDKWQAFVQQEVGEVRTELLAHMGQLASSVAANTGTLTRQGEAIARIEGRLSTGLPPP